MRSHRQLASKHHPAPAPARRALHRSRRHHLHARITEQNGSVSLETALILTFLLPFLFLIAQVALMWHASNVAHAAAQVAVTNARVYEASSDGAAAARAYIAEVAPRSFTSVSVSTTKSATTVQVHVQGTVPTVMGISLPPIDAVAEAPVERVTR